MARKSDVTEHEGNGSDSKPVAFDEHDKSTYGAQSDKKLQKLMASYTEEYQLLTSDQSQAAVNRKVELYRTLRAIQDVLTSREELVEIHVPRSVTGEPFIVGPRSFPAGRYVLPSSQASYLLWLIGENQRVELRRLQQNGREVDLGTIGSRARQIHTIITQG